MRFLTVMVRGSAMTTLSAVHVAAKAAGPRSHLASALALVLAHPHRPTLHTCAARMTRTRPVYRPTAGDRAMAGLARGYSTKVENGNGAVGHEHTHEHKHANGHKHDHDHALSPIMTKAYVINGLIEKVI